MADYTTTNLVSMIKTRGMIPSSQVTFGTSDFVSLADDELKLGIVPFVMKNRSEYFGATIDVALTNNQASVPIPSRAIGGKIRGVLVVDSSGNEYDLPEISREDKRFYAAAGSNSASYNFVFYFEGNNVVLVPTPTNIQGASLRFSIYQRPNALIQTSSAAQITAINTGTNTVTVASVPSGITTSTMCDLINGTPGFECRAIDLTPTATTSTTITFSSLPSTLAVGDWVAPAQQSPIPQIPLELFPMLEQRTVVKVLEALGDAQGFQTAQTKLKEMEDAALHLLSPRSDSNPKKIVNRFTTLRSWGGRGYTRY